MIKLLVIVIKLTKAISDVITIVIHQSIFHLAYCNTLLIRDRKYARNNIYK